MFRPALRLLCLAALVLAAGIARADIRVRVEEAVNGADPVPVIHWFGPDRAMRDDGNRYIITRLDQQKIYVVDRDARQYQVVDLPMRAPSEVPAVSVERTDDTRRIGDWQARRYRISGPAARKLTIDVWLAEDPHVDISGFRNLMVALSRRPGSAWLAAYRQIKGFPVLQEVELSRPGIRLHSTSKVVAIEQADPAPDTYAPPADFTRVK